MIIKNIKYILCLEGKSKKPNIWGDYPKFQTVFEFSNNYKNDEEALIQINKLATSEIILENSNLEKINDWWVEKTWEICDEIGRIKSENKIIQNSLCHKLLYGNQPNFTPRPKYE